MAAEPAACASFQCWSSRFSAISSADWCAATSCLVNQRTNAVATNSARAAIVHRSVKARVRVCRRSLLISAFWRSRASGFAGSWGVAVALLVDAADDVWGANFSMSVSYTHLTLPTIYSV